MIRIIIEGGELFNEETETFSEVDDLTLDLEHSLISLSKWESKHQKPFLTSDEKTKEEIFDYIACMLKTPNVSPESLFQCSQENLEAIQKYIDSSQSATTFGMMPEKSGPGETITSELIYYWMVAFNIPFECQDWHLNRLFALVRICNIKNAPPKQMSRTEIAMRNREENARRKAKLGTSG